MYVKSRDSCNYNFRCYKRPRKLKTANICPHVFEAKSRKFGDAKIFHFTVCGFCLERFPLPLGAWDGLRYFIVALPEPSINYFDLGSDCSSS